MNLSSKVNSQLPPDMAEFIAKAQKLADEKGNAMVLVGGMVRDLILGQLIKDLDIMLNPPVEPFVRDLAEMYKAKVISHPKFMTFTIQISLDQKVDVVTAREETYSKPAALPDVKPANIDLDLKRRDFTINAIACRLNKEGFGDVLDPFSGMEDIQNKVVRVLHTKSFEDDPTRIFRAARFAARFGFELDSHTESLLKTALKKELPALLSPVRRRHEFELILKEKEPLAALELLEKWSALSFFHKDWRLLPDHKKALNQSNSQLRSRLVSWLKPWGKDKAQEMMTALSFERAVKRDALSDF